MKETKFLIDILNVLSTCEAILVSNPDHDYDYLFDNLRDLKSGIEKRIIMLAGGSNFEETNAE